jgi:multidrug transporter EmrE-like cation transporter
LTVGILIWSTTNLITGWAGGRFGIFGINPQVPSTTGKLIMNYISVTLAALSAVFFLFIKSSSKPAQARLTPKADEPLSMEVIKAVNGEEQVTNSIDTDFPFLNRMSDPVQKALGSFIAGLSGIFYGLMFIPDQYIRDHPEKFMYNDSRPPNNGLYYVGSQYSGILLSSLFYFVLYAALKRNRPTINPSVALPAMISGTMWGIANIGFIVAISALKSSVAYPIVSVLPGIITSLWSLFWFREIQGKKNYILLVCGMLVRCTAALLSGLSA